MPADPTKLKVARQIDRPGICFGMARVPGTTRVFYGSSDFKVYEIDVAAEKPAPIEMVGHESYVSGVALAGQWLVSAGWDGKLIWWEAATRKQVRIVSAHAKWIRGVTASSD